MANEKTAMGVLLIVETDDPRLSAAELDKEGTTQRMARIRAAVLQRIPKDVTRVVAVLPPYELEVLMRIREQIGIDAGLEPFVRPPPGYVKPTTE